MTQISRTNQNKNEKSARRERKETTGHGDGACLWAASVFQRRCKFHKHAMRLRERCYLDHTFFFGYCNGHSLYFPTIEGVSEGGYGADEPVAPVQVGAGEEMMNQALINIYELTGKIRTTVRER